MGSNSRSTVDETASLKKKHTSLFCLGGLAIITFFLLALIVGGLLVAGFFQVDRSPKIIKIQDQSKETPGEYTLTPAQNEILTEHGSPHTFAILFYSVENESGIQVEVRDETWTYFNLGTVYQFINGELVEESPYTARVETTTRIPCAPHQFFAEMTLDEIVAAAGLKQYLEIPLEDELVPNSRLYYADRLTFALQDGRLRYIETLPIEGEVK